VLVKAADVAAVERNLTKDRVGGREVVVGPWVHTPKDKTPTYFHNALTLIRRTYGAKSKYAHDEFGVHFEFKLGDTVNHTSGTGKSTRPKGTIYCRKVFPLSPSNGTKG
jgi:hypothetical protein